MEKKKNKLINRLVCPRMVILLLISLLVVLPAYAAIGSPQISITEPKNASTISAGDVMVSVEVKNFTLVDKLGKPNVAGEGHLHYYMDVNVPMTPGKPAVTAVGTFAPTTNTTFTWKNVTAGNHNFSVQLANNDHTPLIPLVYSTVNITATPMTMKTMSIDNVTINLVAKNIAFNTTKITVPAGANIDVNFDNQDQYVPHNFAIYTDESAKTVIFQGKTITGPAKIIYTFVAPTNPGTYFFRCDVHPTTMNGQFIVE